MPRTYPSFHPDDAALRIEEETDLGALPVWDLADLYSAPDAPEVKADIALAAAAAADFNKRYKGQVAVIAGAPGGGAAFARDRKSVV